MSFTFSHAIKESLRRKCYFAICLLACFLVTLVSLVSKTVVQQGSLIFVMLSERETGEMDIILDPIISERSSRKRIPSDYFRDYAFLNYTLFAEIMKNSETSNKDSSILDSTTLRTNLTGKSNSKNLELILINTTKEKDIQIGRTYKYEKLKKDQCLVHKSLTYDAKDKKLKMTLDLSIFIRNTLLDLYYLNKSEYNPNITKIEQIKTNIDIECNIVDNFTNNHGKSNSDKDELVIMELEHFYKTLSESLTPQINEMFPKYKDEVYKINPNDYGNNFIINFPGNRISSYVESDYDKLVAKGAKYANSLIYQMNSLEHIEVRMPLIKRMGEYRFGSVLLNLILNIIIISLFILSIILIYSLLLITMETNSFEFGLLRLIGSTKKDLILIVIFQCLTFSVPAFILAFLFHFLVLKGISVSLRSFVKSDLDLHFSWSSFIIALVINFLGPIIAAFFPIKSIIQKNIATSLNTAINKTQGMKIEVVSIQTKETKFLLIFGLVTFIYGAIIYYFLPLSLMSLNFTILGYIFIWILLGILIGFVILAMNIENLLQKFLTYVLLFPARYSTKKLVYKNLVAHRLKNRKTTVMYSLSVGLFIMTGFGLNMLLQMVKKEALNLMGSEVVLSSSNGFIYPNEIRNSIKQMFDENLIVSFSYMTPELGNAGMFVYSSVNNLGKTAEDYMDIIAVTPGFFNTTDKSDMKMGQKQKYKTNYFNKHMTPSEQLYLFESKGKIGLSGVYRWKFKANINDYVFIKLYRDNLEMTFMNKPAFIINSASGVFVTDEPMMILPRDTLFSIPHYMDLMYKINNYFSRKIDEMEAVSYSQFPIDQINLKLNKKLNVKSAIDRISDIVNNDPNYTARIWLYNDLSDVIKDIHKLIFQIFYIASTGVLFFCFFNLIASMTINIFDQKKEIAILRALGMKKLQVIFIYVAEAIILILASSIIGTVIGSLISYTMLLQFQMFMGIRVKYNIQAGNIILLVVFSLIGGILSTIFPAISMLNESISILIRSI